MPKIPQYNQEQSAQVHVPNQTTNGPAQLSDFGGPGLENFGSSLISAGNDVGRMQRALNEQDARVEVTKVQATYARMLADATLELDKKAREAPPGVTTFADIFNEGFNERLNAIDETFQTPAGRQAWTKAKAELGSHFVLRSGEMQARLAGAKAIQDFAQTVDSFQIVVNNDPAMFEATKGKMDHIIQDSSGTFVRIAPEHRAEIQRLSITQLANAAMEGVIRQAPDLGMRLLEHPDQPSHNPAKYLTGEQVDALKSKALAGEERIRTLKEREYLAKKRAEHDRAEDLVQGLTKRILDPKQPGGMPSDQEIAASGLTGEKMAEVDAFKFRRLRELESLGEDRKHPQEVHQLLNQMIADGEDPTKVYNLDAVRKSYRDGRISTAEFIFLSDRFTKLKDDTTNTFEKDLNNMMGSATHVISNAIQFTGQPDAAMEAIGRIRADAYTKAERLRKENKDPRAMLDPTSKEYFFSRQNLSTYMLSPSQALRQGADKVLEEERKRVDDEAKQKRTEQFIKEGQTMTEQEIKQKYIPGYQPPGSTAESKPVLKEDSNAGGSMSAATAVRLLDQKQRDELLDIYRGMQQAVKTEQDMVDHRPGGKYSHKALRDRVQQMLEPIYIRHKRPASELVTAIDEVIHMIETSAAGKNKRGGQ